jgi:hypothetical protein
LINILKVMFDYIFFLIFLWWTYSNSYLVMSKFKFFFDKHT